MWKKYKGSIILTTIITLLPILAGVLLWDQLPEQVAIHFNSAGEPDNFAPKAAAVLGLPVLLAVIHLFCLFMTDKDPKRQNISAASKMLVLWVCPFISWLGMSMTISYSLGRVLNIGTYVSVFLGILFIIIGNYMPKCTPSYTIGIRLPWTLADDDNWRYTHRIGGFSFTIGGVLILLMSLFGSVWLMLAVLIAMVLVPLVASYLYYRRHR